MYKGRQGKVLQRQARKGTKAGKESFKGTQIKAHRQAHKDTTAD
jgi:hypothetical protein